MFEDTHMLVLTHKYTKLKAIHNLSISCYSLRPVGANAQIYKIESNSQLELLGRMFTVGWC